MAKYTLLILFACLNTQAQLLMQQAGSCTTTQAIGITNIGGGVMNGTASVPSPFIITSGANYALSSNQSSVVWLRYCPNDAAFPTNTVTFTGGNTASATIDGRSCLSFNNDHPFSATAGTIAAADTNGGVVTFVGPSVAYYMMFITNLQSGVYYIRAVSLATNLNNNSLLYSFDANPVNPLTVWDMPISSSFTNQLISGRGIGNFQTNKFTPMLWRLSRGIHQLVIWGREDNEQLQTIEILQPAILTARIAP